MLTPPSDIESAPPQPAARLVAYDRERVYVMLRDWTPERLHGELAARRFGARLAPEAAAELDEHLTAWRQRALGQMSLRDTLLVDRRRGQRVFDLVCAELTVGQAALSAEQAQALPLAPADLARLPEPLGTHRGLGALARRAAAGGLALAVLPEAGGYPYPEDLAGLLPAPPSGWRQPAAGFEQPTGWRRRIAALLATAGVALLTLPLLLGTIPEHAAGAPLALLTLALLVGIKAGPAGFAGSLCIWLVANLPGFRHGSSLFDILWPALPLMAVGLGLLALDRHVRAMWRWLRGRARR